MTKQVGIRLDGIPTLGELLYFDQITLVSDPRESSFSSAEAQQIKDTIGFVPDAYIRRQRPQLDKRDLNMLEILSKKDVVVDITYFIDNPKARNEFTTTQRYQNECAINFFKALGPPNENRDDNIAMTPEKLRLIAEIKRRINYLVPMAHRAAIESDPSRNAVCILNGFEPPSQEQLPFVVQLVLTKMPHPNADTAIERVLDFRSDEDAQRSLRRLRRWMTEIGAKSQSLTDCQDELESLIDTYTEYMNVHHIKYEFKATHSILTASLDVIENIMKLRLKPAYEALFSLSAHRIELAEAELKAPGREVAYIVKAHKAFT